MSSQAITNHEALLEEAWNKPGNTVIELPPVDVNQVLRDRYEVDPGLRLTRTMLWDMEARKAAAPDKYIPTVVRPGSAEKFPSSRHGRFEDFSRVSDQRLWTDPSTYGTVIEHVRLDHDDQRAFFVGAKEFTTPDGRTLRASEGQPIFHVEHSVAGTEERPLNLWRIMHLTGEVDPAITAAFEEIAHDPYLRVFVEVYIRDDLGYELRRRPVGA